MIHLFQKMRLRFAEIKSEGVYRRFKADGYKPWTPGYERYKWEKINQVLANNNFYQVIGTERYGYRIDERIVEYPWLLSKLAEGSLTMLDAGSALNYWHIVNHPKIRDKKLFISTLAPEGNAFWNMGISYVFEDIRQTCFREEMFDCIACISTIEHVGMDNTFLYTEDRRQAEKSESGHLEFLDILRSRLKTGGKLFLSFPFGLKRDHGWFQVFDATMVSRIIDRFQPSHHSEEIFQYSGDRWHVSTREAAKNATCFDINVQKDYDSDFAAFSRGIACLELVK